MFIYVKFQHNMAGQHGSPNQPPLKTVPKCFNNISNTYTHNNNTNEIDLY